MESEIRDQREQKISGLLLKPCQKNNNHANHAKKRGRTRGRPLNRKVAKYAKLKTRSRCIVQNRDTVLDKAAFSFAVHPANEKNLPAFLCDLSVLSDPVMGGRTGG